MPIDLNVGSEFDEEAARRATAEAREYYARQAAELKLKAKLDVASAQEAAREAGEVFNRDLALIKTKQLRVDAILNQDAAKKVMMEFNAELKALKNPVIKVDTKIDTDPIRRAQQDFSNWARDFRRWESDVKAFDRAVGNVASTATKVASSVGQSTTQLNAFQRVIQSMGLTSTSGLGAGGPIIVTGMIAGLVELAGVAASAAEAIWLLPAAGAAAGAGLGTLMLATHGFTQALGDMGDVKKFAEDLKSLAPDAQQAALAVQSMMPAFHELQQATEGAFFTGFAQIFKQLATEYLPSIQNLTTGIASSFNQMFSGVATQLMTPETMKSMQEVMNNIVTAFHELAPAMAPITKAFADIMAVGSGFLPQLARDVAALAQHFSEFITHARETGDLKRWMGEGLETLKKLADGAKELGGAFMELAPIGRDVLPHLVDMMKALKDIMPEIGALALLLGPAFGVIQVAATYVKNLVDAFNFLRSAVPSVANAIIPVLNRITQAIGNMLGTLSPAIAALNALGITNIQIPQISQIGQQPGAPGGDTGRGAGATVPKVPGGNSLQPGGGPGGSGPFGFPGAPGSGWFPGEQSPGTWNGPPASRKPNADGTWGKKATGAAATPFINPSQYMLGNPLAGMPAAAQGSDPQKVFEADSALITQTHDLEQQRLALLVMKAEGNHTQEELLTTENNIQEKERELYDTQAKDLKARTEQMKQSANDLKDVFVPLDQGFGLSEGIPGLVKNLTILMGDLALAKGIGSNPAWQQALTTGQSTGASGPSFFGVNLGVGGSGSTNKNINAYNQANSAAIGQQYFGPGVLGPDGQLGPQGNGPHGTPGSTPGYASDASLLSNVPSGSNLRYGRNLGSDLTKGLGDCSSAVEDLVNIIQGRPTAGAQMSTHNEAQWLGSHGFMPNTTGGNIPGAFNVGWNDEHTQATLPQGTNFNYGSDTAVRAGGRNGGGAFDPTGGGSGPFTQHYYLPMAPTQAADMGPGDNSGGGGGGGGGGLLGLLGGGPGSAMPNGIFGGGGGGPGMGMPSGLGPGGFPQGPQLGPGGPGGPGGPAYRPGQPPGLGSIGAGAPPGGPGMGAAPTGGVDPQGPKGHTPGAGGWQPAGGGFGGLAAIDAAGAAGAMAADAFAPGSGAAVQMATKLANRAIGFAGQAASIGVQGLFQTFLPSGSDFADPSKSWPGRILGGFAGARPADSGSAGQTAPPLEKPKHDVDPNTKEHGKGEGQPPGPVVGTLNYTGPQADGQAVAKDISRQTNAYGAGQGHG